MAPEKITVIDVRETVLQKKTTVKKGLVAESRKLAQKMALSKAEMKTSATVKASTGGKIVQGKPVERKETSTKIASVKPEIKHEKVQNTSQKAKIDVYLNDSPKHIKPPEQKIVMKTYEEAFLASIAGNLGPRNASKRPYNQYLYGKYSIGKETDQARPRTPCEKTDSEPEVKKVKTEINLADDIEELKNRTSKFLDKYNKKGNTHGQSTFAGSEETITSKKSDYHNEQNYLCKKKMAANQLNDQSGHVIKIDIDSDKAHDTSMKSESKVSSIQIKKKMNISQELVQLSREVQQQTSKPHKILSQREKFLPQPTSSLQQHGFNSQINLGNIKLQTNPLMDNTLSNSFKKCLSQSSGPTVGNEFGKNAASNNLDFSMLANQGEILRSKLQESVNMNLQSTIEKLSTALQVHPPSKKTEQCSDNSESECSGNLTVDVTSEDHHYSLPGTNSLNSPNPQNATSLSSVSPHGNKSVLISPTRGQVSPRIIFPSRNKVQKRNGRSPTAAIQTPSPSHISPSETELSLNSLRASFSSLPPVISQTRSPVIISSPNMPNSPPMLSPADKSSPNMMSPNRIVITSPLRNVQSSTTVTVSRGGQPTTQSGYISEQGQILGSTGFRTISNGQSFIPLSSVSQNASRSGVTLNQNSLLSQSISSGQVQAPINHASLPVPNTLSNPQVKPQQIPGQLLPQASVGINVVTNQQSVNVASQGLLQLSSVNPNVGGQQVIQRGVIQRGNQTFLVQIPVMRPITSTTSGNGQLQPTSNLVTAVSSQGNKNQVGQILFNLQNSKNIVEQNIKPQVLIQDSTSGGIAKIQVVKSPVPQISGQSGIRIVNNIQPTLTNVLIATNNTNVSNSETVSNSNISLGHSVQTAASNQLLAVLNKPALLQTNEIEKEIEPSVVSKSVSESINSNVVNDTVTQTSGLVLNTKTNPEVKVNSKAFQSNVVSVNGTVTTKENLKAGSLSPPLLQSPTKTLQLVPQPIVPISQTFPSSTLSSNMVAMSSESSLYNCSMPANLFDTEDSDDGKPPTLEIEAPMLEMEAPILKLESEADTVSLKSDPDTLSNYSVGSGSVNFSGALKPDVDTVLYPMSNGSIDPLQTLIQTASYNSFTGKTPKKRRKSGAEGTKENKKSYKDGSNSDESSPGKKVSKFDLALS